MTVIINYLCHSIAGIRLILFPIADAPTTAIVIQFIIEADVIRIRCGVDITKKSIKPSKHSLMVEWTFIQAVRVHGFHETGTNLRLYTFYLQHCDKNTFMPATIFLYISNQRLSHYYFCCRIFFPFNFKNGPFSLLYSGKKRFPNIKKFRIHLIQIAIFIVFQTHCSIRQYQLMVFYRNCIDKK